MVVIPKKAQVRVYLRSGQVLSYPSVRAAMKSLGREWLRANLGPHFRVFVRVEHRTDPSGQWVSERIYDVFEVVMRSEQGEPILADDLPSLKKPGSRWRRLAYCGHGPVPGAGQGRNGSRGRWMRSPKTLNERRQAQCVEPCEPGPRAKRNASNLPTAWNDLIIQALQNHNWKRFRRTRYKTKAHNSSVGL